MTTIENKNELTYTIIKFIHNNKEVTDKEIIDFKQNYDEQKFLISFNHLVENGYIVNQHTHSEKNDLKGEAEKYSLSEEGNKLFQAAL